jgi:hypothetical protein
MHTQDNLLRVGDAIVIRIGGAVPDPDILYFKVNSDGDVAFNDVKVHVVGSTLQEASETLRSVMTAQLTQIPGARVDSISVPRLDHPPQ